MRASIVVPSFNRLEVLRRTLPTLITQNFPADYEILVVDDGSTDGTTDFLGHLGASRIHIIRQPNRGPAAARNAGLRSARGDTVIFVDDDMLCNAGLIRAHVSACESNPRTVSIGAIFLSGDCLRTLATDCFEREIGSFHLKYKDAPGIPVPQASWVFSNTAMRRAELLEIGGFDESLRKREDADLGLRLSGAGFKLRYSPLAVAHQLYGKSAWDLLRDAQAFAAADRLLIEKYPAWKIASGFEWPRTKPAWRRAARRIAAGIPLVPEAMLSVCWLAASRLRAVIPVRQLGARALQWHRHLVWYRAMRMVKRARAPRCGLELRTPNRTGNPV